MLWTCLTFLAFKHTSGNCSLVKSIPEKTPPHPGLLPTLLRMVTRFYSFQVVLQSNLTGFTYHPGTLQMMLQQSPTSSTSLWLLHVPVDMVTLHSLALPLTQLSCSKWALLPCPVWSITCASSYSHQQEQWFSMVAPAATLLDVPQLPRLKCAVGCYSPVWHRLAHLGIHHWVLKPGFAWPYLCSGSWQCMLQPSPAWTVSNPSLLGN